MRELGVRKELKGKVRCTRCHHIFLIQDSDKCPNCDGDVVQFVKTVDSRQVFATDERKAQPL